MSCVSVPTLDQDERDSEISWNAEAGLFDLIGTLFFFFLISYRQSRKCLISAELKSATSAGSTRVLKIYLNRS